MDGVSSIESNQPSVHLEGRENLENGVFIDLFLIEEESAPTSSLEHPSDLLLKLEMYMHRLINSMGLTKLLHP